MACDWVECLIAEEHAAAEVVALRNEMECVGVRSGIQHGVKGGGSVLGQGQEGRSGGPFAKEVLRRRAIGSCKIEDGSVGERGGGGPIGYLVWKMMVDGNYLEAVNLVIDFKDNGLKPEVYSYMIALTALVKEQKEFSKAGFIVKQDVENLSVSKNIS